MSSFMRRSLGLESNSLQFVGEDGVGIDVEDLFGEVDKHGHHAPNVGDENTEIEIVCESLDTVQEYVDVLEATGDKGAPPLALAIAEEAISTIFKRHGVQPKTFSKEALTKGNAQSTKEAIAYAKEGMKQIANEGILGALKNTFDRMKVNMQQVFRRRTAWRNEALKIKKALSTASGAPKEGALYSNAIRIAHMTTGDQKVVADGTEMLNAVQKTHESLDGVVGFLTGLMSLYSWFNKDKGKIDLDAIAGKFEMSLYSKGQRSVSGTQALFGEEFTMTDFGGVTNNVNEMMETMRGVRLAHNWVWRVKDLEIQPMAPLSIQEMRSSIEALIKCGDEIVDLYNRNDREMSRFHAELYNRNQEGIDIDMIVSPILYFRFHNAYMRLLQGMIQSMDATFNLNFMAATSMLDYYRWSLANNK